MTTPRAFFLLLTLASVAACSDSSTSTTTSSEAAVPADPAADVETIVEEISQSSSLADILAAQPEEVQARYVYRNPAQTLEFFGIEPGMTVVEALPGGGWYSKLLLPYLGSEGKLIGANYAPELWPNFSFATPEYLETVKTWTTDWPAEAQEWRDESSADVTAFVFSQLPESMHGTADAVVLVRALHNMARFEGGFLEQSIQDSYNVLKPGGVVGIVQHEARPEMPDEWANGARGYLKKSMVIEKMTAAGFEYVGDSDVNENPKDQPGAEDIVWRLPPSLATSRENEALKAELVAVGESNRMTLKFRKPAA
ncbi:MAG: methyltransferase [Pseudomonadota bacterium]